MNVPLHPYLVLFNQWCGDVGLITSKHSKEVILVAIRFLFSTKSLFCEWSLGLINEKTKQTRTFCVEIRIFRTS